MTSSASRSQITLHLNTNVQSLSLFWHQMFNLCWLLLLDRCYNFLLNWVSLCLLKRKLNTMCLLLSRAHCDLFSHKCDNFGWFKKQVSTKQAHWFCVFSRWLWMSWESCKTRNPVFQLQIDFETFETSQLHFQVFIVLSTRMEENKAENDMPMLCVCMTNNCQHWTKLSAQMSWFSWHRFAGVGASFFGRQVIWLPRQKHANFSLHKLCPIKSSACFFKNVAPWEDLFKKGECKTKRN